MKTEVEKANQTEPEVIPGIQRSSKKKRLNVNGNVVTNIIQKGRKQHAPARGALILSGISLSLLWTSFAPMEWGPIAWIALVPFLQLVRIPERTKWMYASVYLTGFIYSMITVQWMRLGHPLMYFAMAALAFYWAFYFPLFLYASRVAYHRFKVPFVLTVPVVWVGLEFFRAYAFTGFSWYYLGHSQYQWNELIQVSDLVGAYGVSFLVAMLNASLAVLVGRKIWERFQLVTPLAQSELKPVNFRKNWSAVIAGLLLFSAVLGYGYVRRSQAEFKTGPRVALIQGNFPPEVKHDPSQGRKIFNMHHRMTGTAVQYQPDVIVWPESMYPNAITKNKPGMTDEQIQGSVPFMHVKLWKELNNPEIMNDISLQAGAAMFLGLSRIDADEETYQAYNSVAFVDPKKGYQGTYDKIHRVIFGEYVPLKETFPFLKMFSPYPGGYELSAGKGSIVFPYKDWNFTPIICFEDTVPHLVRKIVASGKKNNQKIDCMINATNDGWFRGSSELNQHMITSLFRSIECRTPMVRAVNTGISCIIDGNGMIVEPVAFVDVDFKLKNTGKNEKERKSLRDPKTGQYHKELNAVVVGDVPLDNRESFYLNNGDWFAAGCGFGTFSILILGIFPSGLLRKEKS